MQKDSSSPVVQRQLSLRQATAYQVEGEVAFQEWVLQELRVHQIIPLLASLQYYYYNEEDGDRYQKHQVREKALNQMDWEGLE